MNTKYVRGIAPGTMPADRLAGKPPSEDQMLLEIEIRLQVAARKAEIRTGNDNWWQSSPVDTKGEKRRTRITIPRRALEAQGSTETAENLGLVTEMTTHSCLLNDGLPPELRTGNRQHDSDIASYIAGAAGDQAKQFGVSGRFEPSQSELPPEQREALFIDLEYFDEMIAEKYDKHLTEADVYREAEAIERKYFDPAQSDIAREVLQEITGPQPDRETGKPLQGDGLETHRPNAPETPIKSGRGDARERLAPTRGTDVGHTPPARPPAGNPNRGGAGARAASATTGPSRTEPTR